MPDESTPRATSAEEGFSCVCCAPFKHRSSLMVHIKSHTEEKNFMCEYCSQAFRQKSHLDLHINGHTKEKLFVCQTCNKEYLSKRALLTHWKVHHTKEKSYKCNICQETFSYYDHLKRHIVRHSGIKAFACGICSKCFSDQVLLTSHMRVHSSDKQFECDTCGKKFARRQMLQCHLVIHTGLKPYKCKECQKRFTHNSDALKHQKIHSGIRPFACQLCSSAFVRRANLTRHSKTHNKIHKTTNEPLNKTIYNEKLINDESKSDYRFGKSSLTQKKYKDFKQQSDEATLVELKNGPYVPDVKLDDSGIVDIQFIYTSLKDDLIMQHGEEYVEIKSKEELDAVVNTLGKQGRVKVLIGRENKDGDWEYEEVETIIEKTIGDPESSVYEDVTQVVSKNENDSELFESDVTDASSPWKCALCNSHFENKSELTAHIKYSHTDFTMFNKYAMKLVINKSSGEMEKNPLAIKQKIYPLSEDVLQPVFTKYVIKDRTFKEPLPKKQTKLLSNNCRIFGSRKPFNFCSKNNNIVSYGKKIEKDRIVKSDKYNCIFQSQNDYTTSDYCNTQSENCNAALENCNTKSENCNPALENCKTKSENCNPALENCNIESENESLSMNCKDKSEDSDSVN